MENWYNLALYPSYLYITFTSINILISHPFRFIEIIRMIDHSLVSNNVKFLKLGLNEYAENPRFESFNLNNCKITLPKKHTHPSSAVLVGGGEVHDTACWFIS